MAPAPVVDVHIQVMAWMVTVSSPQTPVRDHTSLPLHCLAEG